MAVVIGVVLFVALAIVGALIQHDAPLWAIGVARILTRLGQRLQSDDERAFAGVLDDFDNHALLVRSGERSIWWLLLQATHFAGLAGLRATGRLEVPLLSEKGMHSIRKVGSQAFGLLMMSVIILIKEGTLSSIGLESLVAAFLMANIIVLIIATLMLTKPLFGSTAVTMLAICTYGGGSIAVASSFMRRLRRRRGR